MKKSNKKYMMIFLLTLVLNTSNIVYLPSMFYYPFLNAFSLTNEQIGTLLSAHGIIALFGYMFGGAMADKFNPKWLIVTGSIATGLLALYTTTIPSYSVMLAVYALYGITVVLLPWSALLKTYRMMAEENEEGKIFGFFESASAITSVILSYGILMILSKYLENGGSFGLVIMIYASVSIVSGILIAVLYKPERYLVTTGAVSDNEKFDFKQVGKAFKLPVTWFSCIMVATLFSLLCISSYISPYLGATFGLSDTVTSGIGIAVKYVFRIFAAPLGGIFVLKLKRSPRLLMVCMPLLLLVAAGLGFLPTGSGALVYMALLAACYCIILNISRVCMYMPLTEGRTPVYIYGTVMGITSAVGYSGDIFLWKFFGSLLDTYGLQGYTYLFSIAIGVCAMAFITGFLFNRYMTKLALSDVAKPAI